MYIQAAAHKSIKYENVETAEELVEGRGVVEDELTPKRRVEGQRPSYLGPYVLDACDTSCDPAASENEIWAAKSPL